MNLRAGCYSPRACCKEAKASWRACLPLLGNVLLEGHVKCLLGLCAIALVVANPSWGALLARQSKKHTRIHKDAGTCVTKLRPVLLASLTA